MDTHDQGVIAISPQERQTLVALIAHHLPKGTAVWAFGSRTQGTSRPDSDLDLVVFTRLEDARRVNDFKEALDESQLPFRVDVLTWDRLAKTWQDNIQAHKVVLVPASQESLKASP